MPARAEAELLADILEGQTSYDGMPTRDAITFCWTFTLWMMLQGWFYLKWFCCSLHARKAGEILSEDVNELISWSEQWSWRARELSCDKTTGMTNFSPILLNEDVFQRRRNRDLKELKQAELGAVGLMSSGGGHHTCGASKQHKLDNAFINT